MKKSFAVAVLCIVCVIAAAVLIYSRPMTIAEISGGVDVTKSMKLLGSYSVYPEGRTEFELGRDDARFASVTALLTEQKFRRSVRSLLPQGIKMYRPADGDFKWELSCVIADPMEIGGEYISGTVICVSDYYGELEIECVGKLWRCRTAGQEQWASGMLEALKAAQ